MFSVLVRSYYLNSMIYSGPGKVPITLYQRLTRMSASPFKREQAALIAQGCVSWQITPICQVVTQEWMEMVNSSTISLSGPHGRHVAYR